MMETVAILEVKKLKNDEYMEIFLENGKIIDFYKEVKEYGWNLLNLNLNHYFDKPWVNIYGKKNCLDENAYQDFQERINVECIRCFE